MIRRLALSAALMAGVALSVVIATATPTWAQQVPNGNNSVGVIGQDSSTHLPCYIGSPATTCVMPGGGGGGGSAPPANSATGAAVPAQADYIGVKDASGNLQGASAANPVPVTAGASATGGATRLCTGQIKATATACGSAAPHTVYTYELDNTGNAATVYFQFFDVAVGSVTLGTTVATMGVSVPGGGAMIVPISVGDSYANQITLACTTTATGLTAPANNCGYTVFGK